MPAEQEERQDTNKTATSNMTKELRQKQFEALGEVVTDLNDRFNALTSFLEIRVVKNFKKYNLSLMRRNLVNPDGIANRPQKKWYQFWK